jgi:Rod binding domain-containing protein
MHIAPIIPSEAGATVERLAGQPSVSDAEKIADVSRKFEAVLMRQILNQALKPAIHSDLMDDSAVGGMYQDMITSQLADAITQSGGLGLAKNLQAGLTRQLKTTIQENKVEN